MEFNNPGMIGCRINSQPLHNRHLPLPLYPGKPSLPGAPGEPRSPDEIVIDEDRD